MYHVSSLLKLLRRLLTDNPLFRRSIRALLCLWAILRRQTKNWVRPTANDSSMKSITYDPHWINDSRHNNVICASALPLPPKPAHIPVSSPPAVFSASPSQSPTRQSSCASRDLAVPFMEEYDLSDMNIHPNILDPEALLPLTDSDPISTEGDMSTKTYSPVEAAIPAGQSPQTLRSDSLSRLRGKAEPIMPVSVQYRRYTRPTVYVS
jgi:hypothetical protein